MVIAEIQALADRSAKRVQGTQGDLYGAAIRCFGSWRGAVEAAGFRYEDVVKRRPAGYWTRERVIREVSKLVGKSSNSARAERRDLYSAALRIFGSWKAAVEAAGFDYGDVRAGWVPSDESALRFRRKKS